MLFFTKISNIISRKSFYSLKVFLIASNIFFINYACLNRRSGNDDFEEDFYNRFDSSKNNPNKGGCQSNPNNQPKCYDNNNNNQLNSDIKIDNPVKTHIDLMQEVMSRGIKDDNGKLLTKEKLEGFTNKELNDLIKRDEKLKLKNKEREKNKHNFETQNEVPISKNYNKGSQNSCNSQPKLLKCPICQEEFHSSEEHTCFKQKNNNNKNIPVHTIKKKKENQIHKPIVNTTTEQEPSCSTTDKNQESTQSITIEIDEVQLKNNNNRFNTTISPINEEINDQNNNISSETDMDINNVSPLLGNITSFEIEEDTSREMQEDFIQIQNGSILSNFNTQFNNSYTDLYKNCPIPQYEEIIDTNIQIKYKTLRRPMCFKQNSPEPSEDNDDDDLQNKQDINISHLKKDKVINSPLNNYYSAIYQDKKSQYFWVYLSDEKCNPVDNFQTIGWYDCNGLCTVFFH